MRNAHTMNDAVVEMVTTVSRSTRARSYFRCRGVEPAAGGGLSVVRGWTPAKAEMTAERREANTGSESSPRFNVAEGTRCHRHRSRPPAAASATAGERGGGGEFSEQAAANEPTGKALRATVPASIRTSRSAKAQKRARTHAHHTHARTRSPTEVV